MTSKKFINDPSDCVNESLNGLNKIYPGLYYHEKYRFVTKSQMTISKNVAILSGGGSGHEPFCSGYVGDGMLAGAVAGNIFASPPKSHILQAIYYLNEYYRGGILVIIPNYTGDCLNFGLAIEIAKNNQIDIESIIVGEDCASGQNSIAGRRGMCGLLFIYKIAGALAAEGRPLKYISDVLKNVLLNISTLGISSNPCSLPGQGPLFEIASHEMELGTGVHGEAGIKKLIFSTAHNAVETVLKNLIESLNLDYTHQVVVLVNNLGTTTEIEQNIICNEIYMQLEKLRIKIIRMYSGMLMTSLDMSGFQVSILKLQEILNKDLLELLDRKTNAPRWVGSEFSMQHAKSEKNKIIYKQTDKSGQKSTYKLNEQHLIDVKCCLKNVSKSLIDNASKLNTLDSGCGDGDCGSTLKCLADGIDVMIRDEHNFNNLKDVFKHLSEIAENKMGGTSGALHNLFLSSMSNYFKNHGNVPSALAWAEAWKNGLDTVKKYGQARIGDRTIVDVLEPACNAFSQSIEKDPNNIKLALQESVKVAEITCECTKYMRARAGRASYVNSDRITDVDAGAFGFLLCLRAIHNYF